MRNSCEAYPTGQRYIHHRERGSKVLLFVREFKTDRVTNGAAPYTYLQLTLFHAVIARGIPQKLEHNDIRWITIEEISQYGFCPAGKTILSRLSGM